MTYSIVARDTETGELGVAVQSRAFNTGAACAWATPGVGAVATHRSPRRRYGPRGLELLAAGRRRARRSRSCSPQTSCHSVRQVAFLDASGRTAAHTGDDCIPHAGHLARENVSVQGNMLRSTEVWPAMAEAFDAAAGTLAERLLAALDAAETAGGDFRGRQAAGLVVVYGEVEDDPSYQRVFDLRVDDHPEPLQELRRLHPSPPGIGDRTAPARTPIRTKSATPRSPPVSGPTRRSCAAILVHAKRGELDRAAALITQFVAAEPLARATFERYEQLRAPPAGHARSGPAELGSTS